MLINLDRASDSIALGGTIFQLANGSIQGCNREAERILGYSAEQMMETAYFELPWQTIHEDGSTFPPETHPGITSIRMGLPYANVVMGFYQPKGNLIWLSVDSQPLFQANNNEPYGVVVTFRDITDRQTNKPLPLQPNREFMEQLADAVPGVLSVYDAIAGRNIYVNSHAYDLLGYTPEQIIDMGADFVSQVMHPEDRNRLPSHLEELARSPSGQVCEFEYRMRHKNGEWRWFYSQDRVFSRTTQGEIQQILTIAQDISERKQTEINLRQSEERLSLATDASNLGMWFWDLTTDNLEWTERCKNLFGLDADTAITYQLFLNALHPDDSDRTDKAVKEALANQTEYDIEYRTIWSDGSIHWLAAKGRAFYNQKGEPVRMMGTVQDISQRKRAEAELVKTDSILQSLMSDTSSIIFVKDVRGRYVLANQSAAEFLGISSEEIVGKDDTALFAPEVARSIGAIDHQVIEERSSRSYEEEIIKGEKSRSLLTSKYPWCDKTGKILGVIGICRDITAIKQSEQELKEKEQLLRLALSSANAGSWDWEINTGKIVWSPENYDLYGLDPQKGSPEYQDWENKLHPEDREWLDREIKKVVAREIPRFNHEFRIIHPQRGVRWLLGIGNVTVDDRDKSIRLSGINLDITERKQIEAKLRRSQQHLRRILDSLYIFVGVLTPDGILIEANRTALEAANLQAEDVIGKPFAEAYWWSYATEIQAQLNDAIQRAANGEFVRYDVRVRLSQDKYILIDFSLIPLFDAGGKVEYLIPSGIDITDREASKQALRQSEYELRLITEIIPQQVWTALPNGKVDYMNQRWHEYTGVSLKEIRGRGWSTIVHPNDLERVRNTWTKAVQTGRNYNIKARLRQADGSYHWFLGRARPLHNERGEIIKWYGTNTDINRIKQLEEKLRQQTNNLIKANQVKDEFLAVVSHELRTPLNPILGWSQLMAADRLDAEKTKMAIEIIHRNAKLQTQLIEDLLDVSRILRGKLKLQITPVNLESVIKAALATVQLAADAKSIQLKIEFEPNIGQVLGDAGRLQQIVWNLVSNAIKFTPTNGQVTVKLESLGTEAQIQVIDMGQGIDPEFLPYVFDRFSQAESSTTRKFGGLGLGLSIVRHLTELHGGTVAVTSPGEGQGATFRVRLPLMDIPKTNQAELNPIETSVQPNRFNNIKFLVVDDEIDARDILTFVLEQEGGEVTPVASAREALEAFDNSTFDLIISDIGMPEVDGYTLINQIRALPQGKQIPAIALTAYAGEVDREHSLDAGYQRHISKPIDIPELIKIITQLINNY